MHTEDMSDEQIDDLVEKVGDKLLTFMQNLVKDHDLCDVCAHNLISTMCNAYVTKVMEERINDNTRH